MSDEKNKKNIFRPIVKYFKDVKSELKKVVWPTYKQIQKNTIVVLACVLIVGIFIWVLDFGFSMSLGKVVEKYNVSDSAPESNGSQGLPEGIDITDEAAEESDEAEEAPAEGTEAPAETAGDAVNE